MIIPDSPKNRPVRYKMERPQYSILIPSFPPNLQDYTPPTVRPIDLEIAISTHFREKAPTYIHETLASLFMSGVGKNQPVHLFVNSDQAEYLKNYYEHNNIFIHVLKHEDWEPIKNDAPKQKASYNYWRCLTYFNSKYVVVIEDDVRCTDYWLRDVQSILHDIEQDGYTDYILDVSFETEVVSSKSYARVPHLAWCATHGMVYPESVRNDLGEFVYKHGFIDKTYGATYGNYDLLVKEFCMKNQIPIFLSKKKLMHDFGKIGISV